LILLKKSTTAQALGSIKDIRRLYKPVQPVVKQWGEHVTYREFLPAPGLQDVIYCYWELKTTKTLDEPFSYCVVADGCIDIFFELKKPEDSFVMGFCKKYTEFPLDASFHYVGLRFLPSMFPQLFKINASALSNRYEALKVIAPETANFIQNNFHERSSAEEIKTQFDTYFLRHLTSITCDNDPRFYEALFIILDSFGAMDVEKDLNTGISARQLRRLFEFYVGTSPKTFSKVVRFQSILQTGYSSQSLKQSKAFFDAGYYDQAHFIKEFKAFYGITPGKVFGR
jgi:hypothetical protein